MYEIKPQSVADIILNLPLESIVVIHDANLSGDAVLHRTGISGWRLTRGPDGYRRPDFVRRFIQEAEGQGAKFTVVREGAEF